ncbi:MAG: hypothetical protein LH650_14370 [Chloroflexi bacterium]|nr:hypothetical protein [Chloroflexota bacterium]
MSIKPWPTLTLLMEGGPDDGLRVNATATDGAEPPEKLVSGVDPLGAHYLRHPVPGRGPRSGSGQLPRSNRKRS